MRTYLLMVTSLLLFGCAGNDLATKKISDYVPDMDRKQLETAAMTAGAAYLFTDNIPKVPERIVSLSPNIHMTLEKIVTWGALAGVAYMVIDPLAPNWEIEEAAFPGQRYHLALKMKRVYSGGAGEAHQVFQQRAKELMYQSGYDGFETLEYREGLDSSVIGSQRTARGVIRLTRR
jgi:ABC-type Fe3+-hydroxamate transport system substrate-binding protein